MINTFQQLDLSQPLHLPKIIKTFNSIPNKEAMKLFKYVFLNSSNFSRTDLVPNLIIPQNFDA